MRLGSIVIVVLAALNGACTADSRPTADDFLLRGGASTATAEDDATEAPTDRGEVVRRAALLGEVSAPAPAFAREETVSADAPDAPRP